MKCKYCKREIPGESIFCMFCGEKIVRRKKKKDEVSVPKPRQLPSGSWFGRVTVNGERCSITEATEQEYYAKAKAVKLGMIQAEKKAPALALEKAIDSYIESKRAVLSPSTILGYIRIKDERFLAYGKKDIHFINWQQLINDESELCSAKTLKNAWALARSAVRAAGVEPGEVSLPQIIPNEHPYLTPEQIPSFISGLDGAFCRLPALLALNGLRQSELLALTWDKIDLEKKTIRISGALVKSEGGMIRKETNKNASSRREVPIIIPALLEALSAVEDKTGPVTTISTNGLYKGINRVCDACGLPRVGVHGLRHSFASLCYHLQIPEKVAMQFGGWSSPDVLGKIYTHIPQSDLDANADKIIDFISEKMKIGNENGNEKKKA